MDLSAIIRAVSSNGGVGLVGLKKLKIGFRTYHKFAEVRIVSINL